MKECPDFKKEIAQEEFVKKNETWTNKEFFKNLKTFAKLNNKTNILNLEQNNIYSMEDVKKMENEKKPPEDFTQIKD